MTLIEMIGYGAALLTTGSFVPQAWHTFRTRDVSGISLGMYGIFVAGTALWLSYGLLIAAWPVVIANGVTLALALAILGMKLRFHERSPPSAQATHRAASAQRTPGNGS